MKIVTITWLSKKTEIRVVLIATHKEPQMFATQVWISHRNVTLLPASALCFGRPHVAKTGRTGNKDDWKKK